MLLMVKWVICFALVACSELVASVGKKFVGYLGCVEP